MEQADEYIKKNSDKKYFASFYEFLNYHISEKGISVPEIIHNSGLNKNYAYNIINGAKKNPSRDKVIAICIGMKLDVDETLMALRVARKKGFDLNEIRDVWLLGSIQAKAGNAGIVNEYLTSHGLEPLNI